MLKNNPKTRCERMQMNKAKDVVRCYNKIQVAYAKLLEENGEITEFSCNVPLEGEGTEGYTTDFLCRKVDGTYRVRECVWRKQLLWPSVEKLLEMSRDYWYRRGVEDWGIVIDEVKTDGNK